MTLVVAALAMLFAETAPPARPLMAECAAAVRNEPTLDATRLPTAFRTEIRPIGWQDHETLYLLTGIETATLRSGAKLTVTLAGCENYSNSYAFELVDPTSLKDGRHWFETAARLMGEVETVSPDAPVRFSALQSELRVEAARRPPHDFGGGEFLAREDSKPLGYNYRVTVERADVRTVLTVDYWVPL